MFVDCYYLMMKKATTKMVLGKNNGQLIVGKTLLLPSSIFLVFRSLCNKDISCKILVLNSCFRVLYNWNVFLKKCILLPFLLYKN